MNKETIDIIRVWRCDDCCSYEIDFKCDFLYCRHCGKEMKRSRYKEVGIENKGNMPKEVRK